MEVTARSLENLQVEIRAGRHQLFADEPAGFGDDRGPNPYELLLGALGACKVMTVKMYAKRKGWQLEDVEVVMSTYRVYAKDCEDCESDANAKVDVIEVQISFTGELSEEQVQRLVEISEMCPVHRTLTSETRIRTAKVASAS